MAGSYHIIIVTSETLIGLILLTVFRDFYTTAKISLVPAGLEALMLYDQSGADLVISTENIGVIDTLELTRTLRNQNFTLPLIILSRHCAQAKAAQEAGVSLFLCDSPMLDKLKSALPQLLTP